MTLTFKQDPTKKTIIIVATKRATRPAVTGKVGEIACPFCPGCEKNTPKQTLAFPNSKNWRVRGFKNKFGFLTPVSPHSSASGSAFGYHEVIVTSEKHGQLFQDYSPEHLKLVFKAWKQRFVELSKKAGINCIYLFANHGPVAGASINHEHCQITALAFAPPIIQSELDFSKNNSCIYCKMTKENKIIINENEEFVAVCPTFPRFAYETWIIPKKHLRDFTKFSEKQEILFMQILSKTIAKIYPLSSNYNLAFHQSTRNGELHFHVEIYPRKDKWAGFELGAGIIVNTTGEKKAIAALKTATVKLRKIS